MSPGARMPDSTQPLLPPLPDDDAQPEEPGENGWTATRGRLPDGSPRTYIFRGDPGLAARQRALNAGRH
jgi:hypothetical protein